MTAWHKLDGDDMASEVTQLVRTYRQEQSGRRDNYIYNLELFEGRRLGGYSAHSYTGPVDDESIFELDRLGLVRSAVQTAVANFYAPQKPKPQFQTLGATWAIRRKAYRLDRICEGVLNQRQGRFINVWAFMVDAATDSALQGSACIKITADKVRGRIVHELVPEPDLFCEPAQGREPLDLFQRAPIDAEEAAELWPDAEDAIMSGPTYEWHGASQSYKPRVAKVVELAYGWRLPTSQDEPGVYCAAINGKLLEREDWTAPAFPFVFLQWEPHRDSPWASGISDEMRNLAQEASELDARLMLREINASGKFIFCKRGSVKPEDLTLNDPKVIVVWDGDIPPQESVQTPFNPVEVDFLRMKKEQAWDRIGISQMSAAARREPNITSGIAQMTLNDTKAGRQLLKSQRYEQAFVDLAHQYVWRLRELAQENKDFAIKFAGKRLLREQRWDDADVEDDMFSITVAPSASLPHDPAGRQQMIESLFQSGLVSQETAKLLIGWPDIDSELEIENAEAEYVDALIEKFLEAQEDKWGAYDYQAPEGFLTNKVRALTRFAAAWFRAKIDQMSLPPEEQMKAEFNIGLLVRYIRELDRLMNPPAPPPEEMPANDNQVPMGGPGPDQLPQAPMGAETPQQLPPNPIGPLAA